MRRRTKLALIAGGTSAVVAGAAIARGWLRGRGKRKALPHEDALFTVFAPGGPQALWSIGPVRWLTSRIMPIAEAGVYRTVADMLALRPDDTLLDIGCRPGGFAAAKAQHVGRVVGLDTSPLMLRAAERRLADRIAAGTAELVLGNAAQLPFGDSTFSAATAIYAPASAAEGVPGAAPRRSVRGRRPRPADAKGQCAFLLWTPAVGRGGLPVDVRGRWVLGSDDPLGPRGPLRALPQADRTEPKHGLRPEQSAGAFR